MSFALDFWTLSMLFLLLGLGGKILGGGLVHWGRTRNTWEALTCGLALNGRGSVDLVLAALAFELGFLPSPIFGALVASILVSIPLTSWLLRKTLKRACAEFQTAEICPEDRPLI